MTTLDRGLQDLLTQLLSHASLGRSPPQVLEDTLRPMIRLVLRRGLGHPLLIRWVQGQSLDNLRDPVSDLARELSQRLVVRLEPLHGRETVFGP